VDINRRDFFKFTFGSALLLSSPFTHAASASAQLTALNLANKKLKKLSFMAYKTTTVEGSFELTHIEGQIPSDIDGRFIKIGPGTKELFGNSFNHFFDGDAYVSEFTITPNKIVLNTSFLKTPARLEEQREGKMLYHEFGTRSPEKKNKGRKNQPNINLIPWNGSLLALSEGGHPMEVSDDNFKVKSIYNFNGSLPEKVSFTAHPKFDPDTHEGFAFGTYQGISKALKVFKMNPNNGELIELYSINQKHVYMIHDMLMTKNHIIFVIPPAFYQIKDIVLDRVPLSKTLKFDQSANTRVLVLAKDGKARPMEFNLPSRLVFHNGNAFEENGILTFQTFMTDDQSLLDLINLWQSDESMRVDAPSMYEIKIDLNEGVIKSLECLLRSHDFPIMNEKFLGKKNNFLYCASMGNTDDPMAFDGLTKYDLSSQSSSFYKMKDDEMCGEPFFVARSLGQREDDGYLCYIGYNREADQSFLEILDATDLKFQARIWANCYLPLGFHGHYIPN
jgi:carotenoid cleavage dioxygenase-like enzyme